MQLCCKLQTNACFVTDSCIEENTVACENRPVKIEFLHTELQCCTHEASSVEQLLLITMTTQPHTSTVKATIYNADSCKRVLCAPLCAPGYFRIKWLIVAWNHLSSEVFGYYHLCKLRLAQRIEQNSLIASLSITKHRKGRFQHII